VDVMQTPQLPPADVIRGQIASCRKELTDLKRALRAVEALERAEQARQQRQPQRQEVHLAS
jgi:hypothetical protein